MKIKCVDCGCYPGECIASKSAFDCPTCSLDKCCCWYMIHYDESGSVETMF